MTAEQTLSRLKVKEQGRVEAFFESYKEISFDEADDAFQELDMDLGEEMVAFIRRRPELFVGKVR